MTLEQELGKISGVEFHPGHELTSRTTFRLTARADYLEVKSLSGLAQSLKFLGKFKREYVILGWGANQILPAHSSRVVIHLDLPTPEGLMELVQSEYNLPASLGLNQLTSLALKHGYKGWEVFTGIPASLGGAIFMNAGTNLGEIGSLVKSVELMDPNGNIRTEVMKSGSFSYRHNHFVGPGEIIVGATLTHFGTDPAIPQKIREYLEYRKKTQPLATRNCGCVFKNPTKDFPAGKLIDLLGLKELRSGGIRISPKHANFMENTASADWNDFHNLVSAVQFHIDHFYGLEFELEVKIPYH